MGVCLSLLLIPPAFACIVIAAQYDASTSTCHELHWHIDMVTYLYIAGGVQIALCSVSICFMCYMILYYIKGGPCTAGSLFQMKEIVYVFYLVWAAIGLHNYIHLTSPACKEEDIAKMVLAWSVIQYALIPLVCCSLCCMACCDVCRLHPEENAYEEV